MMTQQISGVYFQNIAKWLYFGQDTHFTLLMTSNGVTSLSSPSKSWSSFYIIVVWNQSMYHNHISIMVEKSCSDLNSETFIHAIVNKKTRSTIYSCLRKYERKNNRFWSVERFYWVVHLLHWRYPTIISKGNIILSTLQNLWSIETSHISNSYSFNGISVK